MKIKNLIKIMLNKKVVTLILSFVVVTILVITGFLVAINFDFNQNQNINTTNTEPVKTIVNGVDISDWKTYRNEEYGYSIKYPEDWELNEYSKLKTGAIFKKGDNGVHVWVSDLDRFLDDTFLGYVKRAAPNEIQNFESLNSIKEVITNSGIKGYETTWNTTPIRGPVTAISNPIIYFEVKKQEGIKNRHSARFTYYSENNEYNAKIFNTMIKTFDYID